VESVLRTRALVTASSRRPSRSSSFEATLALAAGDTLDFTVGYGPDGNYFRDTTGLDVRITIPERPQTVR
jgi:hypothetical protein